MRRLSVLALAIAIAVVSHGRAHAQVSAEQVRQSIQRGVDYLKQTQNSDRGSPRFGSWGEYPGYPGGVTALCTLALLNSGVEPSDTSVQAALAYLRKVGNSSKVYSTALQTMAFAAAEPQKDRLLIRRNVAWLEQVQVKTGEGNGGWAYGAGAGEVDNSNSQFALLALYEAERVGVEVSPTTWGRAVEYWKRHQRDDGSWGYRPSVPSTGSMTCAGIASLVIASGQFTKGDASVSGGVVHCCGEQEQIDEIERGLQWMGKHFSATRNPSRLARRDAAMGRVWLLYYLYGMERVGRMTGRRFIERHDWYREGVLVLLRMQDQLNGSWKGAGTVEGNSQIGSALALLFLSKGRRPVLMAKLRRTPADDWNYHRNDLAHLTRHVEQLWQRDMTWQTIDVASATVDDLLQTPVLFISGRNGLELTNEQKQDLRRYVDLGGFIFAESCCDGRGFDRDFRRLMKELFPDSPLRLLPSDHPVWFAEQKVNADYMRPLWGVDACCRTSIVYCPKDLSCYWELDRAGRTTNYPKAVQDEIAACNAIGANVLAYATNRELRDKLDAPQVGVGDEHERPLGRGVLYVAKLSHSGGSDDAPSALSNLLTATAEQTGMAVSSQKKLLATTDATLLDYPVAFLHGRRNFQFTPAQRKALANYVAAGGMVVADSICASEPFANAFRREMQLIFPEQPMQRVPLDHPLLTPEFRGFDIAQVTLRNPRLRTEGDPLRARLTQVAPLLEGIAVDGRYVVLFSPYDLSCALENQASLQCKGYTRADAAKIGINMLLYALQQ